MTTAFLLLGGMEGPDGYVDSAGMEVLPAMLKPIRTQIYTWDHWSSAAVELRKTLAPIALIGYSGGGSRATWLANMVHPHPIDLLVLYDPSPARQTMPIKDNVRHCLVYHNNMQDLIVPFVGRLGGGKVTGHQVETIEIDMPHLAVQADAELHKRTVEAVKAL